MHSLIIEEQEFLCMFRSGHVEKVQLELAINYKTSLCTTLLYVALFVVIKLII